MRWWLFPWLKDYKLFRPNRVILSKRPNDNLKRITYHACLCCEGFVDVVILLLLVVVVATSSSSSENSPNSTDFYNIWMLRPMCWFSRYSCRLLEKVPRVPTLVAILTLRSRHSLPISKTMRQCGPVVRALALRSGDPGFKTRSDHSLNLFLVGPGSTSQLH